MNKQQKIIVSIAGITIVLLALLGITYAYYLTRIEGNTNTNSISITTADLKLAYDDGNEIITASNIVPNTTIAEKTFTVTNTGNSTIENYRVVLELASIEGVVPSVFKYPNDFEITLTCESKNNTTNVVSGTCNGYTGYWNNETFEMQKNTIDSGIRHEYSLTIKYVDSGIDQSDDMGKNLNLKVQIYGELDTSTLNGTITGVDSTYAMKLNSNPKVSALKPTGTDGEYRYSFIGVEPGEHTLSLVNKDGEVVSSETITINKGTEANVNGNTITVKDNQSTIHLTTNKTGTSISSTATFNPYSNNTNSLAYHIINNAKINKNGTEYRDVSITTPLKEKINVINYKRAGVVANNTYNMSITGSYANKTWYYYDTYEVDEKTGKFTLNGKHSCVYSECYANLKDKYLFSANVSDNTNASKHYNETISNIFNIYKVSEVASSTLSYAIVFSSPNEAERVLSTTVDDYGTSYYYRGDVKDNYVNFAGLCWRVVRIQGDGSVKLILEDASYECNNQSFTGNWYIGKGEYGYNYTDDNNNGFYGTYGINYLTGSMPSIFKNYQKTLAKNIDTNIGDSPTIEQVNTTLSSKLKVGDWCFDDLTYSDVFGMNRITNLIEYYNAPTSFYYGSYVRMRGTKAPTLKCNGTIMDNFNDGGSPTPMYIATLTADEMVYAGAVDMSATEINNDYYLMNYYSSFPLEYDSSDVTTKCVYWWSLSPSDFLVDIIGNTTYKNSFVFSLSCDGRISNDSVYDGWGFYNAYRPSIILKSGSDVTSGEGTQTNPYVIE